MSDELVLPNEIKTIATLAAKSFARTLEREKRQGSKSLLGQGWVNSLEEALSIPPDELSWAALGNLEEKEPGSYLVVWEDMMQYARDELENGHRAASVGVGDDRPMSRARFLALREKYIREWQPRNVLESQMIDAICQAQTLREYWMKMAVQRAASECEIERFTIETHGKRRDVVIDGSQAARDAREEAERWDRVFIRAVRALRDLRRYTTAVIVNNQGGQVNVASGEQTNVVEKAKGKKSKARKLVAPDARKLEAVK